MPFIAAIGSHLPRWGCDVGRSAGWDEDGIVLGENLGARAGLTPSELDVADVAEVHDFFTGSELISYEDVGFADRFHAHKLIEADVTTVGGQLPVLEVASMTGPSSTGRSG